MRSHRISYIPQDDRSLGVRPVVDDITELDEYQPQPKGKPRNQHVRSTRLVPEQDFVQRS